MAYEGTPRLASRFSYRGLRNNHANRPLTDAEIMVTAPSIFALDKHEDRSKRYTYIPTSEVLTGLRKEGFEPFHVAQCGTRVDGREGFTKHFMRLRHGSQIATGYQLPDGRRGFFEIIVINSHDGSCGYQMLAGWFEFVCQNGLIRGATESDLRIRHSGRVVEQVIEGAYSVLAHAEVVSETRKEMAALQLTSGEQRVFANAAMELRFADAVAANKPMPIEVEAVVMPKRYEDAGADLWSTFNRTQEALVGGGVRKVANPKRREYTRPVKGIDGNVALNRALWVLAEGMKNLKAA